MRAWGRTDRLAVLQLRLKHAVLYEAKKKKKKAILSNTDI